MAVIILGVDPGLANTGWGVIETDGSRLRCLAYGCIRTSASMDTAGRCATVHRKLADLIGRYSPVEAAFEDIYFGNNVATAMSTGHARGAALVAAAEAGLGVGEYGPGQVKLAVVGNGSADKGQVTFMVRTILGLDHDPTPDHAADALAVAICHSNSTGGVRGAARAAGSRR